VDGLANVTGGTLTISAHESLANLGGLRGLTSVGLQPALTKLRGLSALESVGEFVVEQNALLPTCEAEWLLFDIGIANVSRRISIRDNDDAGVCP
jgi:hypothetical protein